MVLAYLLVSFGSPVGGRKANRARMRPERNSQTPQLLLTPTVYNAQCALKTLVSLKEFNDFDVFVKKLAF